MASAVYTLLCHRDMPMASITLPLLLGFLNESQALYIIDDGSLEDEDEAIACGWGKNIHVLRRSQREEHLAEALGKYSACREYRAEFPFAHKLLDLPLLAKQLGHDRFLYTDSDVLFLRNCQGFLQNDANLHLQTDAIKLSVKLFDVFFKYGWKIPYRFNAGFFSYPTHAFDFDLVEYFLAQPECRHFPWVSEQTCWAVLFGRLTDVVCPDSVQFVCREKFEGPDENTRAIHLIGSLKPHVFDWSQSASDYTVLEELRFYPSRYVKVSDWLKKSLRRFGTKVGR